MGVDPPFLALLDVTRLAREGEGGRRLLGVVVWGAMLCGDRRGVAPPPPQTCSKRFGFFIPKNIYFVVVKSRIGYKKSQMFYFFPRELSQQKLQNVYIPNS